MDPGYPSKLRSAPAFAHSVQWMCIAALAISAVIVSEESVVASPSGIHLDQSISFDSRLESVFSFSGAGLAMKYAEKTGDKIILPYGILSEELRPVLRINLGAQTSLVARPIGRIEYTRSRNSRRKNHLSSETNAEFKEIFGMFRASDSFSLTAGRHNFQWGTSDLSSPSNWIFRQNIPMDSLSRNPLTTSDSRDLLRLNMSAGQVMSVVLMAEYDSVEKKSSVPGSLSLSTGKQYLGKLELAWSSGADFLGVVVAGAEKSEKPFFGEYVGINLTDALFVYADAGHSFGSDAYYPSLEIFPHPLLGKISVPTLKQNRMNRNEMFSLAVGGVRYTFEGGTEIKFEYMHNDAGYNVNEMDLARRISDENPAALPLLMTPNLEFISKRAVLCSIRGVDAGIDDKMTMILRYFKPIQEKDAGAGFFYADYAWSDNAVVFLLAGGFHGKTISEASLPYRVAVSLGQKYVW